MEIKILGLEKIVPYENNPRRNESAVAAVAESIRQCGYVAPIVIDEDGVILAGHTRYKALKKLNYSEAEVIVKEGLTDEQKQKYRLLDNKTAEFAFWDFEKLEQELEQLDFGGFNFDFPAVESCGDKSYIDEILNDDFIAPQAGEKDFFSVSFYFPKTYEKSIKEWLKNGGKEKAEEWIIEKAEG